MSESVWLWREAAVVYRIVDRGAILVVGRVVWWDCTVLCLADMGIAWQNVGHERTFAGRSHDAV